jgi:hypothetical protein
VEHTNNSRVDIYGALNVTCPVDLLQYACVHYVTYWRNLGLNPPNVACSRSQLTTGNLLLWKPVINIMQSHWPEEITVYSDCSNTCSFFFLNLTSFYLLIVGVKVYCCTWSQSVTCSHRREDSSGRGIGPLQSPLSDNTQHSQEADIPVPGGIRTSNPSKRTAATARSTGYSL